MKLKHWHDEWTCAHDYQIASIDALHVLPSASCVLDLILADSSLDSSCVLISSWEQGYSTTEHDCQCCKYIPLEPYITITYQYFGQWFGNKAMPQMQLNMIVSIVKKYIPLEPYITITYQYFGQWFGNKAIPQMQLNMIVSVVKIFLWNNITITYQYFGPWYIDIYCKTHVLLKVDSTFVLEQILIRFWSRYL